MTRDRNIYISRPVFSALLAVARANEQTADEVADGILWAALKAKQPDVLLFYERHLDDEKKLIESLKPKTTT